MKDDRIFVCELKSLVCKTVMDRVFAKRRKVSRVLTLALDAKDHHDVSSFDRVFDFGSYRQSAFDKVLEVLRHESPGARDTNRRAEFCEQMNIRTCDTA